MAIKKAESGWLVDQPGGRGAKRFRKTFRTQAEAEPTGFWKRDNALSNLRQFKVADRELSFLTNAQIEALLAELKTCRNPHAYLIAKLCLSTGASICKRRENSTRSLR